MKQSGVFDVEERLARLNGLDDQIEAFRPDLDKTVVIQTLNNLSDKR